MNRILASAFAIASLALPLTASAGHKKDLDLDVKIKLPGVVVRIGENDFIRPPGSSRQYVSTPKICKLSHVAIQVLGDNVMIQDIDVMFGNGETQDIPTREYFREGSTSNWKPLIGGTRCIVGFWVKARPDRDFNNAKVVMYGYDVFGQTHKLGKARISDF